MSHTAKKLEDEEISRGRDTIPDDAPDPQITIIDTALIRKMVGHIQLWAQDTIIVDRDTEPGPEPEKQRIVEFKKGVLEIIATTFLAPAWEYVDRPVTAESKADLEHIRTQAIQYCHQLANYKYSNCIDLDIVNQIVDTLTTGDWLSKAGLTAIDRELRAIMRLPPK